MSALISGAMVEGISNFSITSWKPDLGEGSLNFPICKMGMVILSLDSVWFRHSADPRTIISYYLAIIRFPDSSIG